MTMTRKPSAPALRVIAGVVALCLMPATGASSQAPTGVVSGVVTLEGSPPPVVRRATVSLISSDARVPLSTITTDDGRFTFSTVPSGHYAVVASKPGFVGAFHGSKRPGRGPGTPIAVPAGGRIGNLDLRLTRGSVISGVLRLPGGALAHNMPVTVIEIVTVNGVRRLRQAGGRAATDDRGEFRFFGLPAGEYLIQAKPSGLIMGSPTAGNDARQTTPAEVSWADAQAQQRLGATTPLAAPQTPERGPTMQYVPVYFPGTADPAQATSVVVGAGEERRGVDFSLVLMPTAKLSGVVSGPDGQPMSKVEMQIHPHSAGLNVAMLLTPRAPVLSAADGSFSIPAVASGSYQLAARVSRSGTDGDLWAAQDVTVAGRDIANVAMTLQAGMTVAGRLAFESAMKTAPSAEDLGRGRVTLSPLLEHGIAPPNPRAPSATVAADGTFAVRGVTPGRYRLLMTIPGLRSTPTSIGDRWTIASIVHDGVDRTDRGLDVRAGQAIDGIVATLTDRPSQLTGTLTDGAGRPAPSYPIVVFSTDRAHWFEDSRRVAIARPATDGTFRLIGLPAGTYFLAAVVGLDAADLADPQFLDQLAAAALKITLRAGETTAQNVRLAAR